MIARATAASAEDEAGDACLACGHAEARHAVWNPSFVGCYECKGCPQWTPPGTTMDARWRQAVERGWESLEADREPRWVPRRP